MGYRERRAHKSQQKQEALGGHYAAETRVGLPAPQTINLRDDRDSLGPSQAVDIVNALVGPEGLRLTRPPQARALITSATANVKMGLISYHGSGTASAEMWAIAKVEANATRIYNIGEVIDGGTTATASFINAPSSSGGTGIGDYTEFNKTIIFVNGAQSWKWNRASAWEEWSASVSAGGAEEVHSMVGITNFKNRLFCWKDKEPVFYYGSTDQIIGNLNSFDLGGIIDGNIEIITSMTRDGGSGPDDFLVIISDTGNAAVYQGTDPGDANAWSLVGIYQIGKPIGKRSYVQYGQQIVVLCADDFYFIPDDLQGKRQATPFVHKTEPANPSRQGLNGIFWRENGLLAFSEGSVIDPQKGFSYTTLAITSADPIILQQGKALGYKIPFYEVYKGRLFAFIDHPGTSRLRVDEINPKSGTKYNGARISTSNLQTQGRTNISLVNPRFEVLKPPGVVASTGNSTLRYRTAVVYDYDISNGVEKISDSAAGQVPDSAWVTTSTSANSNGQWIPGYGTGDNAQICIEVLTASTSADIVFRGIDITVSDTGGI